MLVLQRLVDESIIIGDDIIITVVRIGTRKVKLGITAPPGIAVDRMEIAEVKRLNGIHGKSE